MGNESGAGFTGVSSNQYTVDFSDSFSKFYASVSAMSPPLAILNCIDDFIEHFESRGLGGWAGKVAPSNRLPHGTPDRDRWIEHANVHKLWHVHIGDPSFRDSGNGYSVSDGVLHFQRISSFHIKLLEVGYHRPMELPIDIE